MNMNEYQERAISTAIYRKNSETARKDIGGLMYSTLGLNGEAGEVAEEVKKMVRNDAGTLTPERKEKIKAELGDVLWYLSSTANEIGVDLETIARYNLEKLAKRYGR